MKHLTTSLSLICLIGAAGTGLAQEQGSILLQNVAEKQELFIDSSGVERSRLVPVSTALPGDEIIYTITFTNIGATAAENVVITNPVPEHTRYVDRSAVGARTDISFSVDGGNFYGSPQELVVADGEGKQRPAQAEDYTHIRWQLLSDAEPGSTGFARFSAVLE
jgi:uncharacterized repeat protein (TIGR01451 family)